MNYTAKKIRYRYFELYDNRDILLGTLDYPTWYSAYKAEIIIGGNTFNLQATGFFLSTMEITLHGELVATIKYNWRMAYEITMANGTVYQFKRTRMLGSEFGLYNSNGHMLIELDTTFHFSKFAFSYTFTADDNYAEGKNPLFPLLMLYTLNYFRSRAAS